mgnify:CR=1 FL=1
MSTGTIKRTELTNVEHVTFRNPDMYWDIAADIYFPPDFDKTKKYPAIVSVHPIGSCKEQTSGDVYGAALAEAGFVVLVPDASFQGGSGGSPTPPVRSPARSGTASETRARVTSARICPEAPAATSCKTSSSRGVNEVRGVRTRVMRRSATMGESAESPSAVEWTASKSSCGGASFRR